MKALQEINLFWGQYHKKLGRIEKKRIEEELNALAERLKNRKYKIAYTAYNIFNIPDRTEDLYEHLKFYCDTGRTWAVLLSAINIHSYGKVVDLCPGFAPKVELGLFYLDYQGEVIIVDKRMDSMKKLEEMLMLFGPKYKITPKKIELFKPHPQSYPVVIANHIIDDLVMDYFAKKFNISSQEIYEKEGKLIEIWGKILSGKQSHAEEILPHLVQGVGSLIQKGGWLLMAQYQSYIEKLFNLKEVTRFNKNLFKKLVEELSREGFYNDRNLVEKSFKNFKGIFKKSECYILKKL